MKSFSNNLSSVISFSKLEEALPQSNKINSEALNEEIMQDKPNHQRQIFRKGASQREKEDNKLEETANTHAKSESSQEDIRYLRPMFSERAYIHKNIEYLD